MDTLTNQKGVLAAPRIPVTAPDALLVGPEPEVALRTRASVATARALGAAASLTETRPEASEDQRRRGYRQDSPPEQLALLSEAQAGNTDAFADLYRLHAPRVTRYVAARLRHEERDAVPDVVQDAFTEAFADLANAHHDVTGWLLTHAAKAYIRHIRANRRQERAVTGAREAVRRAYEYGHDWQPPSDGVQPIGHVMLVHGLARLTPYQRELVQHRYLDGQTQATTAELLGKTLAATKSTEHRALARLRRNFTTDEVTS